MLIKVKYRKHDGVTFAYPICETALKFAQIGGHKNLTLQALEIIKSLGYTIQKVI